MTAGHVPSSNIAALYSNTTSGTTADPAVMDAAVADMVASINDNYDYAAGLISAGTLSRLGVINVKDYNASGSAQTTTGSITSGLTALTVAATTTFVQGQGISIAGAGAAGATLITTIASISGLVITLATAAGTTVVSAVIKHDDTVAIQAAITAAIVVKCPVVLPFGDYLISSKLTILGDIQVYGYGYGTRIIAYFTTSTDMIEIGPSGSTRVGVQIKNLALQYSSANCRHVISIVSNTSQLQIHNVDIRSLDSAYLFATGAGINFNGNGLPTGLNDWAEFKHCYIAYCFNGIVVDAANVINCKIEHNTFTLIQDRGIKWMKGGQSQISLNTFQNCNVVNPSGALYIDGGVLASSVSNDIWVGPGNSFQNNGAAGAGTSEIEIANCTNIRIIGNQMQSVDATGAYRAVKSVTSTGITISNNSFQAYTKGATPGAIEIPTGSTASYYDNVVVSGFEIAGTANGAGIVNNTFIGELTVKNAVGTEIFNLDPVTQVATLKSINVDGQNLGVFQFGGAVQLTNGVATIANTHALNACKFFLTAATAKGILRVVTITDGVSFVVNSVDTTGAVITTDQGYFYWMFMG